GSEKPEGAVILSQSRKQEDARPALHLGMLPEQSDSVGQGGPLRHRLADQGAYDEILTQLREPLSQALADELLVKPAGVIRHFESSLVHCHLEVLRLRAAARAAPTARWECRRPPNPERPTLPHRTSRAPDARSRAVHHAGCAP